MAEIKRIIAAQIVELDTDTYCWLLRELAEWCEDQAAQQEFIAEGGFDDFNDNE